MLKSARMPKFNRISKYSLLVIAFIPLSLGFFWLRDFVAVQAQNPVFGDTDTEASQNYPEPRAALNLTQRN